MLLTQLYVRVDILLSCGKYLHDRFISLRGEIWAHKNSLTPSLFIEVPVPSQECERPCIFVLVVSIFLCFYHFLIELCNSSDGVVEF